MRLSGLHEDVERPHTHKTVTADARNNFPSELIKAFFWEIGISLKTKEFFSTL